MFHTHSPHTHKYIQSITLEQFCDGDVFDRCICSVGRCDENNCTVFTETVQDAPKGDETSVEARRYRWGAGIPRFAGMQLIAIPTVLKRLFVSYHRTMVRYKQSHRGTKRMHQRHTRQPLHPDTI